MTYGDLEVQATSSHVHISTVYTYSCNYDHEQCTHNRVALLMKVSSFIYIYTIGIYMYSFHSTHVHIWLHLRMRKSIPSVIQGRRGCGGILPNCTGEQPKSPL